MTETLALTVSLFLIGALHTMIFGTFQYPSNFTLDDPNFKHLAIYSKVILYGSAVTASFCYPIICRFLGLKYGLIGGLTLNLLGLLFLWINQGLGGHVAFYFLDMLFFGTALTSVINVLITYIILKFPNRTGAGITALFAVLNGGLMLAPLMIGIFNDLSINDVIFPFLMLLTLLSIWHVEEKMYDPPFPSHLRHLRKGTLIWKELHYRLALFLLAIISYGMIESSFTMWGFGYFAQQLGQAIALETIPVFYLFMIIGQILLLVPLYFYSPKKIFFGLLAIIAGALYFLFQQQHLSGFLAGFALGGIGCSAIFPIMISMMERELIRVARGSHILPYIETGGSVLIGGYIFGGAFNDLWIGVLNEKGASSHFHLGVGLGLVVVTGVIAFILNLTRPREKKNPFP